MKKIKLTQGKYAIVDDCDYVELSKHRWCLRCGSYAGRYDGGVFVYMHRIINDTPDGMVTDHINRDTLDNRRANLRSADKSLNAINSKLPSDNKSGHKGVSFYKNAWVAEIKHNRVKHYLGRFKKKSDAILARKAAELKYFSQ